MRQMIIVAAVAVASSAYGQNLSSGIDPNNLDKTVRPGDNFYQYAAGGWLKSHPLDDEHTDNGAFTDLYEKSQ